MNASAKAHADIDTLSLASLASFQDHEVLDENDHGSVAVSVSANVASANRFLRPPLDVPVRPLSPDTLSNLSIDEYRQLHKPFRPVLQVPATTWKGKLQSFWERNLGLLYMLVAQMFGTAMNVTTRTLEVEGNKGKGLHPFQVSIRLFNHLSRNHDSLCFIRGLSHNVRGVVANIPTGPVCSYVHHSGFGVCIYGVYKDA